MTIVAIMAGVEQDQTAQNVASDLDLPDSSIEVYFKVS